MIDAVLNFFPTRKMLKQINATTLYLVPKVEHPESVTQFWPIACCNVLYKIISKMLCSRLKAIIPSIINPIQSAFESNRQIMHNILICRDLLKHYKRKRSPPRCTMKIDLRKAYDSISWNFIKELMVAMKFPTQFID